MQNGGIMNVMFGKGLRILLAVVVATQSAWMMPALAGNSSKRLAVKEINAQELQKEFGAGGGGGGSGCKYDYDNDKVCDWVNEFRATPKLGGGYLYSEFAAASPYSACSNQNTCIFTLSISTTRTFSASINTSISGKAGDVSATVGFSASYSIAQTFSNSTTQNVNKGFKARLEAYQPFIYRYGTFDAPLVDNDSFQTGILTGYGSWSASKPESTPTYTTAIAACIYTNCQGG
jgi:hypothetical protein